MLFPSLVCLFVCSFVCLLILLVFQIPWMSIPLLDGSLPVVSAEPEHFAQSDTTPPNKQLTSHQTIVLFCAKLLKTLTQNSVGAQDPVELIQRDSFTQMWLETAWIHKLYVCSKTANNPATEPWLEQLSEVTRDLLAHIKANQWHDVVLTEAFKRAKAQGFVWSLVLGSVLDYCEELGLPVDLQVLLADVQGTATTEETCCHTLLTLISHLDSIYDVKVMTEHYGKLFCDVNSESGELRISYILICISFSLLFILFFIFLSFIFLSESDTMPRKVLNFLASHNSHKEV